MYNKKAGSFLIGLMVLSGAVLLSSCSDVQRFNLFSMEQDKLLGKQVVEEITAQPSRYPLLPRDRYPATYEYLEQMRDSILISGKVRNKDKFEWKLWIIEDDSVQNAFCTPGGYIFIFTGLIKSLNSGSAMAGVMAHEIAHADCRHSTRQMTKKLGIQLVLSFVFGINQSLLTELAQGLVALGFSRSDESEADRLSVAYLCNSGYSPDGAAQFFSQLTAKQEGEFIPEFLSTHPSPENRVQEIGRQVKQQSCSIRHESRIDSLAFMSFRSSLP